MGFAHTSNLEMHDDGEKAVSSHRHSKTLSRNKGVPLVTTTQHSQPPVKEAGSPVPLVNEANDHALRHAAPTFCNIRDRSTERGWEPPPPLLLLAACRHAEPPRF
jgi:hypothetical protein